MVLEFIFGIIILAIVAFIAIRVAHSITLGVFLIAAVFVISYLFLGSFPNSKSMPFIGQFFEYIPSITGQFTSNIGNIFFKLNIVNTARDSQNNLIVVVENNGILDLSGFRVHVDNQTAAIKNDPKEPLRSNETTMIVTDWRRDFSTLAVETNQTKAVYEQ